MRTRAPLLASVGSGRADGVSMCGVSISVGTVVPCDVIGQCGGNLRRRRDIIAQLGAVPRIAAPLDPDLVFAYPRDGRRDALIASSDVVVGGEDRDATVPFARVVLH